MPPPLPPARDCGADAPTRVLVLGASGRLGRILAARWRGVPDLAVLWQYRRDAPAGAVMWDPLAAAPELPAVDVVLGLAGVTRGDAAALARNTGLALAALAAGRAGGARHVFLSSSAAVYGAGGPWREDAAAQPRTGYGRAKLAMEHAARRAAGPGAPGLTSLRIGNVAGADALAAALARGGTVGLDRFADGRGPRRAYVGPAALADVLARLVRLGGRGAALPRVLNLAAPGAVAMADLLAASGHPWRWQPAPPDALPELTLDVARLAALCPLAPADPAAMMAESRALGGGP